MLRQIGAAEGGFTVRHRQLVEALRLGVPAPGGPEDGSAADPGGIEPGVPGSGLPRPQAVEAQAGLHRKVVRGAELRRGERSRGPPLRRELRVDIARHRHQATALETKPLPRQRVGVARPPHAPFGSRPQVQAFPHRPRPLGARRQRAQPALVAQPEREAVRAALPAAAPVQFGPGHHRLTPLGRGQASAPPQPGVMAAVPAGEGRGVRMRVAEAVAGGQEVRGEHLPGGGFPFHLGQGVVVGRKRVVVLAGGPQGQFREPPPGRDQPAPAVLPEGALRRRPAARQTQVQRRAPPRIAPRLHRQHARQPVAVVRRKAPGRQLQPRDRARIDDRQRPLGVLEVERLDQVDAVEAGAHLRVRRAPDPELRRDVIRRESRQPGQAAEQVVPRVRQRLQPAQLQRVGRAGDPLDGRKLAGRYHHGIEAQQLRLCPGRKARGEEAPDQGPRPATSATAAENYERGLHR